MDVGEKRGQVRELDLVVEQLLVGHSGEFARSPGGESTGDRLEVQGTGADSKTGIVAEPVAASELEPFVGLAGDMHHRHRFEPGATEGHPGTGVADDARLGEATGVEAEIGRIDEGDGEFEMYSST